MDVRRADHTDAVALAAVDAAAFPVAYGQWLPPSALRDFTSATGTDRWRKRIAAQDDVTAVWVAVLDGVVMAHAWSRPWTDTADLLPGAAKLNTLYVRPEHQGRGVGSRLLRHTCAWLRTAQIPEAALWVVEANVRARRFYERQGWTLDQGVGKQWRGLSEVRYRVRLRY